MAELPGRVKLEGVRARIQPLLPVLVRSRERTERHVQLCLRAVSGREAMHARVRDKLLVRARRWAEAPAGKEQRDVVGRDLARVRDLDGRGEGDVTVCDRRGGNGEVGVLESRVRETVAVEVRASAGVLRRAMCKTYPKCHRGVRLRWWKCL